MNFHFKVIPGKFLWNFLETWTIKQKKILFIRFFAGRFQCFSNSEKLFCFHVWNDKDP